MGFTAIAVSSCGRAFQSAFTCFAPDTFSCWTSGAAESDAVSAPRWFALANPDERATNDSSGCVLFGAIARPPPPAWLVASSKPAAVAAANTSNPPTVSRLFTKITSGRTSSASPAADYLMGQDRPQDGEPAAPRHSESRGGSADGCGDAHVHRH